MKELKKTEMQNISGGADPILVSSIAGIIITFLIGAFRGYSNPEACRH